MSYNQFLTDLHNNMMYENIAADKICVKNHVTILNTCNDYRYDFKTDDNITYEIKSDKMSNITNNYFIEFLGRNEKPSGISITQEDYYINTNTIDYYLIKTTKLKKLCANQQVNTLRDKSSSGFILSCLLVIKTVFRYN